jgi:TRAP-type mannitol/chloroaromatic compound transport system permease small subunit
VIFVIPLCLILITLSWPVFERSVGFRRDEPERRRPDPLAGAGC